MPASPGTPAARQGLEEASMPLVSAAATRPAIRLARERWKEPPICTARDLRHALCRITAHSIPDLMQRLIRSKWALQAGLSEEARHRDLWMQCQSDRKANLKRKIKIAFFDLSHIGDSR
jgi:hypothetical protein